ncbi:hypothetical protein NA56DRAFT_755743 [Hyaloscypha hepaticicola]|uniref:ABM domain-containing protein n=1 Tax=Hyaloscypha hepaticicola TaxID=2082293 RepID=A0A2J6PHS4_9HELO|nr:hypothetical protein NA56DRAFT_755743 [Hyaloscypha hepaticicola]
MPFPIVFPSQNGPGRLLELCSFRRSKISESRYDEVFDGITVITSTFPISRQSLYGRKIDQPDISVLIADWTSAEEKDVFEPGEQYQSIKPAFGELISPENTDFACHHLILTGPAATPEAGVYLVRFYTVPVSKHQEFGSRLNEHISSFFEKQGPIFFVVAPSRENQQVVVCIWGWAKAEDAKNYLQSEGFRHFQKAGESLYTSVEEYQAKLKKWEARK